MEKKFIDLYLDYVKTCINEKGIHPYPGFFKRKDKTLTVTSFDLTPEETYRAAFLLSVKEDIPEFAFGVDRFNVEGQGIDIHYKSVFVILYIVMNAKEPLSVIVLPYNSREDCGECQYNNKFWQSCVQAELSMFKLTEFEKFQNYSSN